MHAELREWLKPTLESIPDPVGRVLEIGSLNVNGSARDNIQRRAIEYIGIDLVPGPGVDIVANAINFNGYGLFNVVISTEVLEHCAEWPLIIETAKRSLEVGGLLVLTCASDLRKPHSAYGGEHPLIGEYYKGVSESEMKYSLTLSSFEVIELKHRFWPGDLYVLARRV